ncbi:MAG: lipoate--protein ligase family protein [Campylobacteraceae bacterium]|nr:lipoate--protein ligase family protein [Campylobacteraceae bacterium]
MIDNNKQFRLILSSTQSARLNMATDEALVKAYEEDDMPILRLYSWEKSFTIGVSQKFSTYEHLEEYNKNYAKRITGGGVLFHGHDLSYSLLIPVSFMKNLTVKESYEKICTFLLEFYKRLGLKAIYAKDDESISLSKSEFCQVGFEAYDILVNGIKIGGNAQRRTKKLIFQHGSIPIKPVLDTNRKNEIGYCLDEFDINLSYEETQERVAQAFEKAFNATLLESKLNTKEEETLALLLKDKYDYAK